MSLKYHFSQLACIWSPAQSYFWKFGGIWFVILACLLSFAILATHHQGLLYPWACGGSRAGIRRGSPPYCTERRSKSPRPEQCRDASARLSWKHRAWQGRADGAEGTVLAARAPGWADGLGLWGRLGSVGMNWGCGGAVSWEDECGPCPGSVWALGAALRLLPLYPWHHLPKWHCTHRCVCQSFRMKLWINDRRSRTKLEINLICIRITFLHSALSTQSRKTPHVVNISVVVSWKMSVGTDTIHCWTGIHFEGFYLFLNN